MALYKCLIDNSYDGVNGYRKGVIYDLTPTPSATLFEAVSAGVADRTIVNVASLPAHEDEEGDHHIHVPVQFERGIKINGSVYKSIDAITSAYIIRDDDGVNTIEVTTGASDVTITLPTAADNVGRVIDIAKIDNGGGNVVIDGEGGEQIKDEPTLTIDFQWSNATLRSNGTRWIII